MFIRKFLINLITILEKYSVILYKLNLYVNMSIHIFKCFHNLKINIIINFYKY